MTPTQAAMGTLQRKPAYMFSPAYSSISRLREIKRAVTSSGVDNTLIGLRSVMNRSKNTDRVSCVDMQHFDDGVILIQTPFMKQKLQQCSDTKIYAKPSMVQMGIVTIKGFATNIRINEEV